MHSGHFGPAPVSPCTQLAVISFAGTRRSQRGLSPSNAAVIPPNFGSALGRALETGVAKVVGVFGVVGVAEVVGKMVQK